LKVDECVAEIRGIGGRGARGDEHENEQRFGLGHGVSPVFSLYAGSTDAEQRIVLCRTAMRTAPQRGLERVPSGHPAGDSSAVS
jgi:hypothetical protein